MCLCNFLWGTIMLQNELIFLENHSPLKYLLNISIIKYVNHNNNYANHKQYDSRLDMQFEQHGICDICSIRPCYYGGTCGRDLNNALFAKPGNVYVFHHIKLALHSIGNNDRALIIFLNCFILTIIKTNLNRVIQHLCQEHCILIKISLNSFTWFKNE